MKIMVTGGAGFIGSNVVDGYIREGHQVIVVDNLTTGRRQNFNSDAVFYEMDIRSPELRTIIEKERPEIINHHAAQTSVPVSVNNPLEDADVNIKGLLNLLEGAVSSGVKKFIFISSGGAIYGDIPGAPADEEHRIEPLSPYGVSKFASECYLGYYRHQYALRSVILRYANIYGPRQIPRGEAGVVAVFMNNLLNKIPSVLNHYPEDPDGMVRDYCYVKDVVRANLIALSDTVEGIYNIGTGRPTKTIELYRIIYEAVKEVMPDLPDYLKEPERAPARPGDLKWSCLSVEKAKFQLGWTAGYSLSEGIRETLKWWKKKIGK